MTFLFRLIPVLAVLAALLPFVWFAAGWPGGFRVLATVFALLWYGIFELLGRRIREADLWWSAGLVWIFLGSGIGFFLLMEGALPLILTAVLAALLVGFYFEQLYRWFYALKVPSYTLGVAISLVELFTVFFTAAGFIGLRIFLLVPVWILTLAFMVVVTLLFLIARAPGGRGSDFMLAGLMLGVLFGELFWAVLLLPSDFMVGGAILALIWYVVSGLYRMSDLELGVGQAARRYLGFAAALMIIIIFSARWI